MADRCVKLVKSLAHRPDEPVAGSRADDAIRECNDGVDGHRVTREPVTDVAPLAPVEDVQDALLSTTHHLRAVLTTTQTTHTLTTPR